MADTPERFYIHGRVYEKDANGKLVEVKEPVQAKTDAVNETATEVRSNAIDAGTRIKRAIRDATVPIPTAAIPPVAAYRAISDFFENDPSKRSSAFYDLPVGTGQIRNYLTAIGGTLGAGTGGAIGLPTTGPGGVAAAIAGGGIGATAGSGVGQQLEAYDPNLFQSGYAPERNGAPVTEPSFGQAVQDAAINEFGNLVGAGVLKGGKYLIPGPTGRADRRALMEQWMTSKYNPLNKRPIDPVLDKEGREAINAYPNVDTTTGQVLGEDNPWARIQRFLLGEGERSAVNKQNKQIAAELKQLATQLNVPQVKVGQSTAEVLGKRGAIRAQAVREKLSDLESQAYNDVAKLGKTAKITTPPVIDPTTPDNKWRISRGEAPIASTPGTEREVLGPIKLAGSNAAYQKNVARIDNIISQINDPALATELNEVKNRLQIGENLQLKDWTAVREMEASLNALGSRKGLTERMKAEIGDIRKTLENDIERNLAGKIKETASYWDTTPVTVNGQPISKSVQAYHAAKDRTVRKFDVFPEEVTTAIKNAVGEVPDVPNIRGGNPATFYDNLLTSVEDAKRLAKTGGMKDTQAAFMQKIIDKYQNPETGILAGDHLLADLSSDKLGPIADVLMNASQKQNLRYLAKLSAQVNPRVSSVLQNAINQTQGDWTFNIPGDALMMALGGKPTGTIKKGLQWAAVKVKGGDFADAFLNNTQFARTIANNIGKAKTRPGMGKELINMMQQIRGAKLLIQADNKEYWYDTDTKKLTEKK